MRFAMFLFSWLLSAGALALCLAGFLIKNYDMALGGGLAFIPAVATFAYITRD